MLVDIIATSFAGTTKTSPEAGLDWVLAGDKRKDKHFEPLENAPSKLRRKLMECLAKWVRDLY